MFNDLTGLDGLDIIGRSCRRQLRNGFVGERPAALVEVDATGEHLREGGNSAHLLAYNRRVVA
jgi:hypothetical protein